VRGRLGFAYDRWLFYATGGYAYGKVQYDASLMQPTPSGPRFEAVVQDSARKSGWTVGGGVEAAITSILSVKLEYLYVDLGTRSVSAPNGFGPTQFITDTVFTSYHARDHVLRLGFNLRFGGVPGPLMPNTRLPTR
jgi:outer membrane immunogenic protein